jgi:glycosyltransferase involved in cell wall biosynthesis
MGAKVIFDVHENVGPQISFHKKWMPCPYGASKLYKFFEKLLVKGRMRLILAEESYLDSYSYLDPRCVTVLNYPELPRENVFPYTKRENSVGYIGVISSVRGVEEILLALDILRKRDVTPLFQCVGPFSTVALQKRIYKMVQDLGLSNQVVFHGRTDNTQGLRLIEKCRVGLCILHPLPNTVWSYPTKMFEYMALGIPFVASDFELYRRINVRAGGCGLLINPLNPLEIAEAIEFLIKHPMKSAEMGLRARKAVEKYFNWNSEKRKLTALYEELLEKQSKGFFFRSKMDVNATCNTESSKSIYDVCNS